MNNSALLIAEYCKLNQASISLEENSICYTFVKEVLKPYGLCFDTLYIITINENKVNLKIRPKGCGRSDIKGPEYLLVNITMVGEGIHYKKFLDYIQLNREAVDSYCQMIIDKDYTV